MRGRLFVALFGALTLLLAACGDDDDAADPVDDDPTTTVAPDQAMTLSEVVDATMAEGSADYTVVVANGDLDTALDDGAVGGAGTTEQQVRGDATGSVWFDSATRRVMLPRQVGEDDLEVIVTMDTVLLRLPDGFDPTAANHQGGVDGTGAEATDDGLLDDGDPGWAQVDMTQLADSAALRPDRAVLVALHDPAAVLDALVAVDPDAATDQAGQTGEEIDGRDTMRWTVQLPVELVDDQILALALGGVQRGSGTSPGAGLAPETDPDIGPAPDEGEDGVGPHPETPDPPTDLPDPGNGTTGVSPGAGAVTDHDPDAQQPVGSSEIEVHVWADAEDGTIVRVAYALGDALSGTDAGPGMHDGATADDAATTEDRSTTQLTVVVDFDNHGGVDEVEVPAPTEAQQLQATVLQQVLADVQIVEDRAGGGGDTGDAGSSAGG